MTDEKKNNVFRLDGKVHLQEPQHVERQVEDEEEERIECVKDMLRWAKWLEDGDFDTIHICGLKDDVTRSEIISMGNHNGYEVLGALQLAMQKVLESKFTWTPDDELSDNEP